ncbi:unnamed protein product [Knipowitschia caucasica]|uniref:Uncharacterized protein n=1 Tax=Knipowitschia caucasica TaxID=637954 RepID=A0AAV2MIV2_KNICA
MESLQLHSDEAVRARPQREIRLPQHLDNFEVGYQPSVTTPSAVITLPASTTTADSGAAAIPKLVELSPRREKPHSRRSSVSSHHSRKSQSSFRSLSKGSAVDGLSELQSARLEERMKRMELAEAQRQVMEQTLVDEQCLLLDRKARDALNEQEMAHKAKEAISKQQILQRRLKEKEMEVEKAALIA